MRYLTPDDVLDKSDIEWLSQLIANSVTRAQDPSSGVLFTSYEHIIHWNQALAEMKPYQESTANPKPTAAKKKRKTVRKRKAIDDPFKCPTHKTYGGDRRPRSDCDRCWDIYKTKNGIEQYKLARRSFELKQRRATNADR